MTEQEAFDKAARGVIKQGKPAMSGHVCVYLSPEGHRCAVGHLLPEGHPGEQCTGAIGSLMDEHPDLYDKLPDNMQLLRDMQNAHDTANLQDFVGVFKKDMREVAAAHGLSPAVLDEAA